LWQEVRALRHELTVIRTPMSGAWRAGTGVPRPVSDGPRRTTERLAPTDPTSSPDSTFPAG